MQRKEYSAGAVKFSFWFNEFRKIVTLLRSGNTMQEIKALVENDNIFSAATPMRGKQIFNTVYMRVSALSNEYYDIFDAGALETQKLITLIAIMATDTLFFDFMNEVYREKLITGDTMLSDADVRVFFLDKQRENEKVAGWRDGTLDNLRKCYKTYLTEAGLLRRGADNRQIIKPLLDNQLADLLSKDNTKPVLKVLSGTR